MLLGLKSISAGTHTHLAPTQPSLNFCPASVVNIKPEKKVLVPGISFFCCCQHHMISPQMLECQVVRHKSHISHLIVLCEVALVPSPANSSINELFKSTLLLSLLLQSLLFCIVISLFLSVCLLTSLCFSINGKLCHWDGGEQESHLQSRTFVRIEVI